MRAILFLVLTVVIAAVVAACAASRYQTLGQRDANAILAGMALAHQQSESVARTTPHPGRGL